MTSLGLGVRAEVDEGRRGERRRRRKRERRGLRRGCRRRGRDRDGSAEESGFPSSDNDDATEFHRFASAPESFGGRCSFGSDLSALSPSPRSFTHLVGCESSFFEGLDPDTGTKASSPTTTVNISSTKRNAISVSKEQMLDLVKAEEHQFEEERAMDPPIRTVSHNLRVCHNQRVTFESSSPTGHHRRWRPGSLDLNGHSQTAAASALHHFSGGNLKNSCTSSTLGRSNMFPSPGTPNYWHSGSGASSYQKGWSSERVPLPASRGQRFGVNAPLFPYNNGRTMPSKWEDAERWICSPVSGDGSRRPLMLPPYHRRPKSKSGPLGALASAGGSYPSNSPQIPCFDNGRVVNCTGTSPFLAGVLVTDTQVCSFSGGVDVVEGYVSGEKLWTPTYIDRSTSMHGWLDMLTGPSSLLHSSNKVSQGNAVDRTKESTMLSPITLRRDMGTQMSPVGSTHSSPRERPPISHSPPSVHTITDLQSYFPCLEIRDVQVDDCVTVNRWSKKHISRCSDKRSTDIIEWKRKLESPSSHWEVVEAEKKASNFDREEAKIAAWENLQKAKAEAALQKLEMKLEKKRSSSMDKILRRLGSAQRKAEDMRSSVVTRSSRMVSYSSKHRRISSLRGCFTCHTF